MFVVVCNKSLKWILVGVCVAGTRGHEGMGASFLDPTYCRDPQLLGASVQGLRGGTGAGQPEEEGSQPVFSVS